MRPAPHGRLAMAVRAARTSAPVLATVALVACVLTAPRALAAQPAAAGTAACAFPPAASDSADVTLHAHLGRWSDDPLRHADLRARGGRTTPRATPAEANAFGLLLQELVRTTRWPSPMPYSLTPATLFAHRDSADEGFLIPSLDLHLAFTLHADGRATRIALEQRSAMPTLEAALVAGLAAAADSGLLGGLLAGLGADSVRLLLHTSKERDAGDVAVPLFRMRLPIYHGAPVVASPRVRPPSYPDAAARARVTDSIVVRWVVDTAGRVEPATIQLVHGVYREFIRAVLDVLPGYQYAPARIGACPVRMLVQQPFVFRMP